MKQIFLTPKLFFDNILRFEILKSTKFPMVLIDYDKDNGCYNQEQNIKSKIERLVFQIRISSR